MKIILEHGANTEELDMASGASILDVLRARKISPDVSIVFAGSKPVPVDSPVAEGMVLRVVSVVSGG